MAITDLGVHNEALAEMEQMVARGITSFKLFMAYPNVLMIDDGLMFQVMQKAAQLGALICIHAENGAAIEVVVAQALAEGTHRAALARAHPLRRRLKPRPPIEPSRSPQMAGVTVYIVHLSNADALRELKAAQARGLRALAETCTQYLVLSLEEQMPGNSFDEARYVFTPPLRRKANHAPLWQALADGALSVVSTDHCPFTTEQKALGRHDFSKIPNGGPGIENRLQLLWHHGVNAGLLTPERFVALTSAEPARIFGIPNKGRIAPGYDADVLLWDPQADYTITAATQAMNTDYSMFEGWQVRGNVAKVWSRGALVVDTGSFIGHAGHGRFVKREATAANLL